ncbi:tryptophan transporter [Vagococcus zengguangii]|nr:tryptophan transporter [Vagococcus zengguangii]
MNTTKQLTKMLTLTPILIVLGQILTLITPSLFGLIRPDFALVFLFLCVIINPTFKQVMIASLLTVGLSLLAGANPLFLMPSLIDRLLSAMCCLLMFKLLKGKNMAQNTTSVSLIIFISTLVSGIAYLFSVFMIGSMIGMQELLIIFKMGLSLLIITVGATAVINFFFAKFILKIFKLVTHSA